MDVPIYRWRCAGVVTRPVMVKNSGLARLVRSILSDYICLYRVVLVLLVDVMPEVVPGEMRLVWCIECVYFC